MSRREARGERAELALEMAPPSKCAKFLYYTWKLCSVVFSHFVMISLVVAYCILGAVTFEQLESHYEKEVKMNISRIRSNTTHSIWRLTRSALLLKDSDWTPRVLDMLKDFENALLLEMKVRGWDGTESEHHVQWTFTGALFYSIIVITTIGYGHIAPKTQTGKVVTIFYAILGIPLMLLCLSNIGDVMASSFRFLYWRVCCYVCTRPPKRRRRPPALAHNRRSARAARRRRPVLRAHSDTDFRYRDSGYSSGRARRGRGGAVARVSPPATALPSRTRSQPPQIRRYGSRDPEERSPVRYERTSTRYEPAPYDDDEEAFPKISLPLQDLEAALKDLESHHSSRPSKSEARSKSLPRPAKARPEFGPRRDFDESRDLYEMHDLRDIDYENYRERKALERERDDCGYRDRGYDPEDEDFEFDSPRRQRRDNRWSRGRSELYEREGGGFEKERARRARSAVYGYEEEWDRRPRGCEEGRAREWDERCAREQRDPEVGHGRRLRRLCTVDDSRTYKYSPSPDRDEDWSDGEVVVMPRRSRPPQAGWGSTRQIEIYPVAPSETVKDEIKPVPIWLCVCLVASYIVAGTFLFVRWESWAYLDAAYFCFITLTTIGFGDFVPAQGQRLEDPSAAVHSIALCSLYLLFGIALLAMSFNLVQEEVRANVAALATKLGIIKDKARDRDSDTDY